MDADVRKLTHTYSSQSALKKAYMPFVYDGGVFVPTSETFELNEVIRLEITLPDSSPLKITGEVVWITPTSINDAIHSPGVGIQFTGENKNAAVTAIKAALGDTADKRLESDTM